MAVWDELAQFKKFGSFGSQYPANVRTFYTSKDDVHGVLLSLIKSAQHSVVLSMFGYDDDELSAAIIGKMDDEHVFCQISLDRSQSGGKHEQEVLAKFSQSDLTNSVAIGTAASGAISHLKMLLIDGLYLVHGSTNWSASGEGVAKAQDNEATVTNDAVLAAEARTMLDIVHQNMISQEAKRNA